MAFLLRMIAIVLLLGPLAPAPAAAGPLDDAKSAGLVGERIDGLVGIVVANPPSDVQGLVDRVNEKRRQRYARIASERDVPVDAVAQIAGKKLIERSASGEFVAGADGRWRQK